MQTKNQQFNNHDNKPDQVLQLREDMFLHGNRIHHFLKEKILFPAVSMPVTDQCAFSLSSRGEGDAKTSLTVFKPSL
jgi:hypothetical protein